MTLIQRQPRPLTRDTASFRDDRLFYVACDDTFAPQQYFDLFRLTRVHIFVIPTPAAGSCAASQVLERLLSYELEEGDERWMLLDTDHYVQGTHLKSFVAALTEARQKGVNVALSRPSFELWLLLHHIEETDLGPLPTAGDVEKALRAKLGAWPAIGPDGDKGLPVGVELRRRPRRAASGPMLAWERWPTTSSLSAADRAGTRPPFAPLSSG